jgi:Nif-specific regulatory protein
MTSSIDVDDLSPRVLSGSRQDVLPASSSARLSERFAALEISERALIEESLTATGGNLSQAARLLGITWIMMKRRVERFGIAARDDLQPASKRDEI